MTHAMNTAAIVTSPVMNVFRASAYIICDRRYYTARRARKLFSVRIPPQSTATSARIKPMSAPVLLITGGSRGIGAATAKLAARKGYDVALSYVRDAQGAETVAAEIRALGRRAVA